jgi:hypothetical protein
MDLAKGLKLEEGTVIILTDDQYVPALQPKLGVHMDRLRFLSPWSEFQSYVSFKNQSLFEEQSGQYTSEGGLKIKINFNNKKLLDMNSETAFRIVNIFDIKGIKIITIPGIIITQDLMDRFVAAYWVSVGPDVFKLLAKNVYPRDVVRLCGTNKKLRGFCTENFYAEMLQYYYGQTSKSSSSTFRHLAAPGIWTGGLSSLRDGADLDPKKSELPISVDTIKSFNSALNHYFFLTKSGEVWITDATTRRNKIDKLDNMSDVSVIKSVEDFNTDDVLAVKTDGSIWIVKGKRKYGSNELILEATRYDQIPMFHNIIDIVRHHETGNFLFLNVDGLVFLYTPSTKHKGVYKTLSIPLIKTMTSGQRPALLTKEGNVLIYEGDMLHTIERLSNIVDIKTNLRSIMCLNNHGKVFYADYKDESSDIKMIQITGLPKITKIALSNYAIFLVDEGGNVWWCSIIVLASNGTTFTNPKKVLRSVYPHYIDFDSEGDFIYFT